MKGLCAEVVEVSVSIGSAEANVSALPSAAGSAGISINSLRLLLLTGQGGGVGGASGVAGLAGAGLGFVIIGLQNLSKKVYFQYP